MPKILSDKEKIERLTNELATLKAERKAIISNLKKERRGLKASRKYFANRQTDNVNISSSEIEKLKFQSQLQSENIKQLENKLKSTQNELSSIKNSSEWVEAEENKYTLYCFLGGLQTDKYLNFFYDTQNLIVKINPLTGEDVTLEQYNKIMNLLENDDDYKKALNEFSPYKDEQFESYTYKSDLLYQLGESLLKKYIFIFSGYEH